jgi:arginine exporter protein ArgO
VTAALLAGLLAGYGIAVPVGAVAAYLVSLSARSPARVGAAAALGVATVDGGYALLAVLGGAAGAAWVQPVAAPLRWLSVAVLLALAAMTATRAVRSHRRDGDAPPAKGDREPPEATVTPVRAFAGLVAITALNPATVLYFVALVGTRVGPAVTLAERLVFAAGAFVASASWQGLLARAGTLAGRALTGRRARLATALASSVLVTALAVRLAVPG